MDKRMTILVADDHELVRRGLKQVLESDPLLTVIEAGNGEEALNIIRGEKNLIAVLDIEMPKLKGLDVARIVKKEQIPATLIFLTMMKDKDVFNMSMDLGVRGYVLKENSVSELLKCIESVSGGNYYLSPSMSEFLIKRNRNEKSSESENDVISLLTSTELKVLKSVSEMKTNQEIANMMNISIKTVHNHRTNICDKLGLHGAHALLKFAAENSRIL